MTTCTICGRTQTEDDFRSNGYICQHKFPYKVWCEDIEEAKVIYARSIEEAVKEYAIEEDKNSGYDLFDDLNSVFFEAKSDGLLEGIKKYEISRHPIPEYKIREID